MEKRAECHRKLVQNNKAHQFYKNVLAKVMFDTSQLCAVVDVFKLRSSTVHSLGF